MMHWKSGLEYTVSGDNIDGFIVTVDTGVTNLDAVKDDAATTTSVNESDNGTESSNTEETETVGEPEENMDAETDTE